MIHIDQDRIRAIIQAEHSFYGACPDIRRDTRWEPDASELMAQELTPTCRVLDVGCGNGGTLLELSSRFATGLGIDNDPEHLQLAEEAKREQGIQNVDFVLPDYPGEVERLQPESFDVVYSMRGPIGETPQEIQAAHRLLRPDGLLFCEEIAEHHQKEKMEIFYPSARKEKIRKVDEVTLLMEENGFDVCLAADLFGKWIHQDVYAWLQYECNLRAWLGDPLPEPDDPRIALFAERNSIGTGEIETTQHTAWVTGVKR